MKKIMLILLSCVLGMVIFIGCGGKKDINTDVSNVSDDNMLSESVKNEYKDKVNELLKEYNVTNIDILTSANDKKPILSVDMKSTAFLKDECNKQEVKRFLNKISSKLETVSNKFDITILDKNNQIIAVDKDGDIQFY